MKKFLIPSRLFLAFIATTSAFASEVTSSSSSGTKIKVEYFTLPSHLKDYPVQFSIASSSKTKPTLYILNRGKRSVTFGYEKSTFNPHDRINDGVDHVFPRILTIQPGERKSFHPVFARYPVIRGGMVINKIPEGDIGISQSDDYDFYIPGVIGRTELGRKLFFNFPVILTAPHDAPYTPWPDIDDMNVEVVLTPILSNAPAPP